MNFINAVKKPFQDIKKLVIGIIIMLIPIVNLIGLGYFLRIAKNASKKINKMPEWNDPIDLFVKGLIAFIISLIYAIPVLLLALVLIGTSIFSLTALNLTNNLITILSTAGLSLIVLVIVSAIISIISLCALIRYAIKENFGSAFEFSSIIKIAFSGEFLAAWFVSMIYLLAVTLILSFIPFIGIPIATFISGITIYTLLAEAYKKA
ncbi:MAG: DUF4013 domain-containing protein [Candidatus Aenigmarchaeota archaeon]|nr:DUF4013 domain-containing protein [Candidatus Aenigmarchaeota archaeon]